ncbi:MAG TPA: hypothetical protein VK452_02955 [Dissulfurispiraceae bacterium]|nr:hypothetical protein [Dissulfurispiraceae bacterium]
MRQILFVTYDGDSYDEGLSYAIQLTKTLNGCLNAVFVCRAGSTNRFDDLMSAITFAEANDSKSAQQIVEDSDEKARQLDIKRRSLIDTCNAAGINASITKVEEEVYPALKALLESGKNIDTVLLGPSITSKEHLSPRELKKLLKTASTRIVTMERQAFSY